MTTKANRRTFLRVLGGSTGILCQLDAEIPIRDIITRWQPGFSN